MEGLKRRPLYVPRYTTEHVDLDWDDLGDDKWEVIHDNRDTGHLHCFGNVCRHLKRNSEQGGVVDDD